MGVDIKIESRGSDPGKAPRQDLPVMKDGMRDGFGTYTATVAGTSTAFMVKGYDSEGRPHGAEATVDGTKSAAANVPLILAQMAAAANKPSQTFPPMVKLSAAEVEANGTLLIRFIVEESISGTVPAAKPQRKDLDYTKPLAPALEDVRGGGGGMPLGFEAPMEMLSLEQLAEFEEEVLAPAAIAAEAEVREVMDEKRWTGWHVAGAFALGALVLKAFGRRG
jgi:hypothetical protein